MSRKKYNINLGKLAKLFYKYDFFNDYKPVDDSYCILCEVYSALDSDFQTILHGECAVLAMRDKYKKRIKASAHTD